MTTITVHGEILVRRQIEVVQTQFVYMAHHEKVGVHSDLQFPNAQVTANGFRFDGRRKTLGILQSNKNQVERHVDGNSTLSVLEGANAGLKILQRFESKDPEETLVKLEVQFPVKGLAILAAPLLKLGIRKDLTKALEEDRHDLESGRYQLRE